jgi:hypothetical protein
VESLDPLPKLKRGVARIYANHNRFLLPFLEESQLFAQKQILSCQGRPATRYSGEETQTVTDDLAQVPNHPGKAGEDLEHRAIVSR